MLTIDYHDSNADRAAWAAIDRRDTFRLIVRGRKRQKLKRAVVFHHAYHHPQKKGESRNLNTWLKFSYYGFATPTFWGICNHATLAGLEISFYDTDDTLVISFALPSSSVSKSSATSPMH